MKVASVKDLVVGRASALVTRVRQELMTEGPARDSQHGNGWVLQGNNLWALGEQVEPGGVMFDELMKAYDVARAFYNLVSSTPVSITEVAVAAARAGGLLRDHRIQPYLAPQKRGDQVVELVAGVPLGGRTIPLHIIARTPLWPAPYAFFVENITIAERGGQRTEGWAICPDHGALPASLQDMQA